MSKDTNLEISNNKRKIADRCPIQIRKIQFSDVMDCFQILCL